MTPKVVAAEYRFSGYSVDVRAKKLLDPDGELLHLNSRAFDTLLVLLKNHGETLSKSELMQAVWSSSVVEENNLNQAIFSLRRVLNDSKTDSRFIATIPNRGYCFVAQVEARGIFSNGDDDGVELSFFSRIRESWFARKSSIAVTGLLMSLVVVFGMSAFYISNKSEPSVGLSDQQNRQNYSVAESSTKVDGSNTIAVLPFIAMESNKGRDMFALGLHDELINQLSKISSLKVIARNSIMSLVEQGKSQDEIASLLNVESFLSGTMLFAEGRARISLQLHDAQNGISLWSQSYEVSQRDLSEMFSVQSKISIDVASAMETEIKLAEGESITEVPTTSMHAYRYLLSARIAHYDQDFKNEWEWSKKAIELDPNYYDAHAVFSSVNTVLVTTPLEGISMQEHYQMALSSAERLIELNPDNSRGYALKAIVLSTSKAWSAVSEMLDKLSNMNAPMANMNYVGIIMLCFGDFDKAIEIYKTNLQTEPLNLYSRGFLMAALELSGKREEAKEQYAIGENFSSIWWGDTVNLFLAMGRGEPLENIDEITMISNELKEVLVDIDNKEKVKAALTSFSNHKNINAAEYIHFAALAAYSGDNELAIEFMAPGLENSWSALFWVWLPVFDDARKLASFSEVLENSGVVDYWKVNGWPEVCQPSGDTFSCDWQAYPKQQTVR